MVAVAWVELAQSLNGALAPEPTPQQIELVEGRLIRPQVSARPQWRLLHAHESPGDEAGVRGRTRGLLNGPDPTLLKVRGYGIALSTREVADSLYWMNAAACLALPHEQPVLRGRSLV